MTLTLDEDWRSWPAEYKAVMRRHLEAKDAARREVEVEASRARWRTDPVAWAIERIPGGEVWSGQRDILSAVRDHPRVAVRSANSVGKSHTAALTICWWIDVHPADETFVVTTAATFRQVRAVLWRYVRQLHRKAHLPGRVNQVEWIDANGDIVAFGAKPADGDPTGLLGEHARHLLVVVDEAAGVAKPLWEAVDSLATNEAARVLAIGNPDDRTSEFARVSDLPTWHAMKISAFDTPNLTGEDVSDRLRDVLVSKRWVEDRSIEWGEDNPLYVSRVLAEFPEDSEDRVVRLSDLTACRVLDVDYPAADLLPVVLGMDIGEGSDWTVIRERRGRKAGRAWRGLTPDPDQAVALAVKAIKDSGASRLQLDAGGPGWAISTGIKAALTAAKLSCVVEPIRFGEAAREPHKYKNRRAEMWWAARLLSQDRAWDLSSVEAYEDVAAQLCDPRWHRDAADRIVIESKDDIRRRTGRSPDDADALVLAYAYSAGPAALGNPSAAGGRDAPVGVGIPGR